MEILKKHVGKFIGIGVLAIVAAGIMLNMKIIKELEDSFDAPVETPVVQIQQKTVAKVKKNKPSINGDMGERPVPAVEALSKNDQREGEEKPEVEVTYEAPVDSLILVN